MFDRSIIKTNWNRINRGPLTRAGLLTRKIARQSIRRRKNRNRPSPIGTPPFSHKPGAHPPFKLIFSVPNRSNTAVYVGMVRFAPRGRMAPGPPVPGLHEHGGVAPRKAYKVVGRRSLTRNFSKPRQGGLIKKFVNITAHYPDRPFMLPALKKTLPALPAMWKNSIK